MKRENAARFGKSARAREKVADHFMSVASGVAVSLFGGILVLPMIGVVRSMFSGAAPLTVSGFFALFTRYPLEWALFVLFYLAGLAFTALARRAAIDIYDELATAVTNTRRK